MDRLDILDSGKRPEEPAPETCGQRLDYIFDTLYMDARIRLGYGRLQALATVQRFCTLEGPRLRAVVGSPDSFARFVDRIDRRIARAKARNAAALQ